MRLLEAFQQHGTLMFSLMNVVEIASDRETMRSAQIRDLLEQVGPHWVPLTIDPLRIMKAEDTGTTPDGVHPCVSHAFLTDERFLDRLTKGTPTLAHVVDLTRGCSGTEIRVQAEADTTELKANIEDWRDARKADKRALDGELNARFPKKVFDRAKRCDTSTTASRDSPLLTGSRSMTITCVTSTTRVPRFDARRWSRSTGTGSNRCGS